MIFNVKEIVKKKKLVHHENYLIYTINDSLVPLSYLTFFWIYLIYLQIILRLTPDSCLSAPWLCLDSPYLSLISPLTIPHFTLTMPYLSSALPPAVLPTLLEPVVPVRTNDAVIQPCPVDVPHCVLPFFPGVISHKSRATTLYVVINETLKQMFIFLENL